MTVDPSTWIGDLSPLVEDLGVALGLIERKRGQISGNVADKDQAKRDLDFVYSHGKTLLRAMFFLAEMPSQGKSLPSLRRQRRSRGGPDPRPDQPGIPEPSETTSPDTESEESEPSETEPPPPEPGETDPGPPSDGESSA